MEGSRAAIKPQSLLLAVGLVACSIMGLEAAEEVPLDALLGGSAGLLGAETGSLDTMLDNVRQIEESPDPAHMDVQGAAVFSMGGTPSVLGEGASVRDVAMDANEEQARVRQQGEEEVRKWHQQKSRMLGSSERESPEGIVYTVTTLTGSDNDAATKGAILIELVGTKGSSASLLLSANGAGINRQEKFTVNAHTDLGKLLSIKIVNADSDPWQCKWVKVQAKDGTAEQFDVNSWIGSPFQTQVYVPRSVRYTLTVATGKEAGAGTVGKVYITMFGESGATGRAELKRAAGQGFAAGTTATVALDAGDVGTLKKIRLESNAADDWFCESLTIAVSGTSYTFSASKWVGFPLATSISVGVDVPYTIRVKTADAGEANDKIKGGDTSTKGQIYIRIFGALSETKKRPLRLGFDAGNTTVITLRAKDVGEVQQIELSTESTDSWKCQSVQIQKGSQDSLFKVAQWVGMPIFSPVRLYRDVQYAVAVKTGEDEGANTRGQIFITLFGTLGSTDKISLSDTGFDKRTLKRSISAQDVGKITKIRLDTASSDNWQCDEITVGRGEEEFKFAVYEWLMTPTNAFVERSTAVQYVVSLKTGMDLNAGTVSKPLVTLVGLRGETHKIKVGRSLVMGKHTVFPVWATDVGKLTEIKLQSESSDDWMCQSVTVAYTGRLGRRQTTNFAVNAWIVSPKAPKVQVRADTEYEFTVTTGSGIGSGTPGTIEIALQGTYGDVAWRPLGTNFPDRSVVTKTTSVVDVGKIIMISLRNTGKDYWQAGSVSIKRPGSVKPEVFTVERWLGKEGVASVSVPVDKADPVYISRPVPYWMDTAWDKNITAPNGTDPEIEQDYTVVVNTGDVPLGDSTGHQKIVLVGTSGRSPPVPLGNVWARGGQQTKRFTTKGVGNVTGIKLVTASEDGWFCDSVVLKVDSEKKNDVKFVVKDWIAAPRRQNFKQYTRAVSYKLEVWTGVEDGANTMGIPNIVIYGSKGMTTKTPLREIKGAEKGSKKEVVIVDKDIGVIKEIALTTESTDNWFCKSIKITRDTGTTMQPKLEPTVNFRVNQWLTAPRNSKIKRIIEVDYNVAVTTGRAPDSDSQAKVLITMFGTEGTSDALVLGSNWKKGEVKKVKLSAQSIGAIQRVKLSTENSDGWFCDKLTIGLNNKTATSFTVQKWVQHPEVSSVLASKDITYEIAAKTGNVDDAMSQGSFFMKLYGENGETQPLAMPNGFHKGKTVTFNVSAPFVGKFEKIQFDTDSTDGWMVESVHVRSSDEGLYEVGVPFPALKWVAKPGKEKVDVPAGSDYIVSVDTSGLPTSGTKDSIYLTIHGKQTSTPKMLLSKTGTTAGSSMAFRMASYDVGRIASIELEVAGTDNWDCDKVTIERPGEKAVFSVDTQIKKPHLPSVVVPADSKYVFTVTTGTSTQESGSRGSVDVMLVGEQGTTRKMHLHSNFISGSCAVVTLYAANVGKVTAMELSTDDTDSLEVASVALEATESSGLVHRYKFGADAAWLQAPQRSELSLYPVIPFTLIAQTSKEMKAPMRGDIYVNIYGKVGQTGRSKLSAPFIGGETREFTFWRPSVGSLSSLHLSTFSTEKWIAEHVTVLVDQDINRGGVVHVCPVDAKGGLTVSSTWEGSNAPSAAKYYVIRERSVTGNEGIRTIAGTTPGKCMLACQQEDSCKSVEYTAKGNVCKLSSMDRAVGFRFKWTAGVDYYERISLPKPKPGQAIKKVAELDKAAEFKDVSLSKVAAEVEALFL